MEPTQHTRTLRGDQALAQGALAAGVGMVTGYPGSPATGVFDAILANSMPDQVNIRWAPNEMVAMELAFGASLGGTRALLVVKSVGLNVALDPLATMALSGNHAGLVILLGDDPGAWSSQNEQDSRWIARVAEVPMVEPLNVEQAANIMTQAFAWSESIGLPVIVRITGALALAKAKPDAGWALDPVKRRFMRKRNRWVVLPYLVERRRKTLHDRLRRFQAAVEASPYDVASGMNQDTTRGVLAVGSTYLKLQALVQERALPARVLGLSSVWPLPEQALVEWLQPLTQVLVLEECGPFVEEELMALAQRHGLTLTIHGRISRAVPEEGELSEHSISQALQSALVLELPAASAAQRVMPSTVQLCADCPYRPTFEALIAAMEANGGRKRYIVVGETGCMVRANLPPMELFDVKYGLGSGLGLGMGLAESTPDHHVITLVGDSSFFHSDIPAMPYVAQHRPPMTVIVLDNETTALTGGQAHPGTTLDERGATRPLRADLAQVIRGCGAEVTDVQATGDLAPHLNEALAVDDLRVLVVRGPCPRYVGRGEA